MSGSFEICFCCCDGDGDCCDCEDCCDCKDCCDCEDCCDCKDCCSCKNCCTCEDSGWGLQGCCAYVCVHTVADIETGGEHRPDDRPRRRRRHRRGLHDDAPKSAPNYQYDGQFIVHRPVPDDSTIIPTAPTNNDDRPITDQPVSVNDINTISTDPMTTQPGPSNDLPPSYEDCIKDEAKYGKPNNV